jgi:hypothetical protein
MSSSVNEWPHENEEFLRQLSDNCQKLSVTYYEIYNIFKQRETKFKFPIICIGSIIGMLSFGAEQFGESNSKFVSIAVGCASIVISVISSVEAYLKVGETMSNSLLVSNQLKKLKEKIDVELSVSPEDRTNDSTVFLRQCHTDYMDFLEVAPPLNFKKILASVAHTPAILTPSSIQLNTPIQSTRRTNESP